MIYRILTGGEDRYWHPLLEMSFIVPFPMLGAGAMLSEVMGELHLPAPDLTNPRARFWFTEHGWARFGRAVASEGRRRGYVVKVIRRKNPRRSQIVYADEWQVAILPGTPREAGK